MIQRVAIVGSGPSAFYLAKELIKNPLIRVCLLEKRYVPFGLVRFGVAPDHPEVKNVISKFNTVALSPQVEWVGNVCVGDKPGNATIRQLNDSFDAVVLSVGSATDKSLGIPGEDSKNVLSGREFVGWYNGDPDITIQPDLLSGDTAIIVGQGNVALDCARILLSRPEDLAQTDISSRALSVLERSNLKHVHIMGRRNILQASFTSKEVREMMALPDVAFVPDPCMIPQIEQAAEYLSKNRAKKRLMDIFKKGSTALVRTATKTCHMDFLSSPVQFLAKDGILKGAEIGRNVLKGDPAIPQKMTCHSTGLTRALPCSMVIKCIGYQNEMMPMVPFKDGVIPNIKGRVVDEEKNVIRNMYVSGWIKTGPIGELAATLYDSFETARSMEEDLAAGLWEGSKPGNLRT